MTDQKKPHVHAEVIKAWADGAVVQISYPQSGQKECVWSEWEDIAKPLWMEGSRYRVRPEPHKWQEVMDAYKAGKKCQWRHTEEWQGWLGWRDMASGRDYDWYTNGYEYRIKPEPVVKYLLVWETNPGVYVDQPPLPYRMAVGGPLKLTFEEGKLIAAEVLK